MKKTTVPTTDSVRKLATFWESHDFGDFEEEMERVEDPVFVHNTIVKVRLKEDEAKIVKRLAKKRGVKDSEMIRKWVLDRIQKS